MTDPYIGEIMIMASSRPAPAKAGWLPCDGRSLNRAGQYQPLFTVIGTRYGSLGSTVFSLPDLRGHAMVGAGAGAGLTRRVLGERGGIASVSLTEAMLAPHHHTYDPDHPVGLSVQASTDPGASESPQSGGYMATGVYKRGLVQGEARLYKDPNGAKGDLSLGLVQGAASAVLAPAGRQTPEPVENRQPFIAYGFYIATRGFTPSPA